MPVSIARPSIGRIVTYGRDGEEYPAIIRAVHVDSRFGAVDLTFFSKDEPEPVYRVPHHAACTKGDHWRYPDRVEGTIDIAHLNDPVTP